VPLITEPLFAHLYGRDLLWQNHLTLLRPAKSYRDGECHAGVERREGRGSAERVELRDVAGTVTGIKSAPDRVRRRTQTGSSQLRV